MISKKSSRSQLIALGLALTASIGLFWRSALTSSAPTIQTPQQNPRNIAHNPQNSSPLLSAAENDSQSQSMYFDSPPPDHEPTAMDTLLQKAADSGGEFTPWPDGFFQNSVQKDSSKIDVYIDPDYWARGYLVVQRTETVSGGMATRSGARIRMFGLRRINQLVPIELYDSKNPESLFDLDASNFHPIDIPGDLSEEFTTMQNGQFPVITQYYNAYYPNEWASLDVPSRRTTNSTTGEVTDDFFISADSMERTPGTNARIYQISAGQGR